MRFKIINRAGSRDIFSGGVRYYLVRNEIFPTNDPLDCWKMQINCLYKCS